MLGYGSNIYESMCIVHHCTHFEKSPFHRRHTSSSSRMSKRRKRLIILFFRTKEVVCNSPLDQETSADEISGQKEHHELLQVGKQMSGDLGKPTSKETRNADPFDPFASLYGWLLARVRVREKIIAL